MAATDNLEAFLAHYKLIQYKDAINEAGADDLGDLRDLDPDECADVADDANLKTIHKKKFIKAVKDLRDGKYPPQNNEKYDNEIKEFLEKYKLIKYFDALKKNGLNKLSDINNMTTDNIQSLVNNCGLTTIHKKKFIKACVEYKNGSNNAVSPTTTSTPAKPVNAPVQKQVVQNTKPVQQQKPQQAPFGNMGGMGNMFGGMMSGMGGMGGMGGFGSTQQQSPFGNIGGGFGGMNNDPFNNAPSNNMMGGFGNMMNTAQQQQQQMRAAQQQANKNKNKPKSSTATTNSISQISSPNFKFNVVTTTTHTETHKNTADLRRERLAKEKFEKEERKRLAKNKFEKEERERMKREQLEKEAKLKKEKEEQLQKLQASVNKDEAKKADNIVNIATNPEIIEFCEAYGIKEYGIKICGCGLTTLSDIKLMDDKMLNDICDNLKMGFIFKQKFLRGCKEYKNNQYIPPRLRPDYFNVVKCAACDSSGLWGQKKKAKHKGCNGVGYIIVSNNEECENDKCKGTGKIEYDDYPYGKKVKCCATCNGIGYKNIIKNPKNLYLDKNLVTIKKKYSKGKCQVMHQKIDCGRCKGQGKVSYYDYPYGDVGKRY